MNQSQEQKSMHPRSLSQPRLFAIISNTAGKHLPSMGRRNSVKKELPYKLSKAPPDIPPAILSAAPANNNQQKAHLLISKWPSKYNTSSHPAFGKNKP